MAVPNHASPLLSPEEVTAIYGLKPYSWRRMARERIIPYVRVGRYIRFEAADIEAWIANQRRPAVD